MAAFGVDNHFFIVLASLILIYFLWMDLALYYKLQSGWEDLLIVQTYENLNATGGGGASALTPTPTKMAFFDPFNPISVKLLMVDHANHYVYYSACWWLDTHLLHIADKLSFITPDMISMSHVVVAALGARLIVADSINQRRLGVVLFEMRSLLDSYDGMVARARANTVGMSQANGGWGYWMDGICDAIGTVFFFLGAWVLLQKRSVTSSRVRIGTKTCLSSPSTGSSSSAKSSSSPSTLSVSMSTLGSRNASSEDLVAMEEASPFLASSVGPGCGESANTPFSLQRVTTVTVLLLLGQQFISSFLWNRYMHGFHELLEVPYQVMMEKARDFQVATLKSSPFWIICWTWKLLNPHSLMSLLLSFVFFDVAGPLFHWLRYIGYLPIVLLGVFSEAYMQTVMWHSIASASASPSSSNVS